MIKDDVEELIGEERGGRPDARASERMKDEISLKHWMLVRGATTHTRGSLFHRQSDLTATRIDATRSEEVRELTIGEGEKESVLSSWGAG